MSEPQDYENGVADVLAFLLEGRATVSRNVRVQGKFSETRRQIDVLVRSHPKGGVPTTLVVDCKRWANKIDVADVGSFIDLAKDAQADSGLLITTSGASKAAYTRARNAENLRIDIMPIDELKAWRPEGTVTVVYRISNDRQTDAERVLRNAGFRTVPTTGYECDEGRFLLEVFRHYGTKRPGGELQSSGFQMCERALTKAHITFDRAANGVVAGGGTPNHRWMHVTSDGRPTDLKVLADSEAEIVRQLDHLRPMVPGVELGVERPPDWPRPNLYEITGLIDLQ
jgi:hypothetical protein